MTIGFRMMHMLGTEESRTTAAVRQGAIVKIQLLDSEKDIRGNHCFTILEVTTLSFSTNPISFISFLIRLGSNSHVSFKTFLGFVYALLDANKQYKRMRSFFIQFVK